MADQQKAQTTELSVREQFQGIQQLLEKRTSAIAAMLPKHLTPERMIRCALTAISKNPLLLKCTQDSWVLSILASSQAGLEPGVSRGGMHLVPFWNKKLNNNQGGYEVVPIPDYRGLMSMARNTGQIKAMTAKEVYEQDRFEVVLGSEPRLVHVPSPSRESGPIIAFYAVAHFVGGNDAQFEIMWKHEVDEIRARSRAGDKGPWVEDYPAMGRKTVLRRLCNYLDLSPAIREALDREDAVDRGESPYDIDISQSVESAQGQAEEQAKRRTEAVKEKLRGGGEKKADTQKPLEEKEGAAQAGAPFSGFQPNTPYSGVIAEILPSMMEPRRAGKIVLTTEHGPLDAYFWSRPPSLKENEDWKLLVGRAATLSFTEEVTKAGKTWVQIKDFTLMEEVAA